MGQAAPVEAMREVRSLPAYPLYEASLIVGIAASTLRRWVRPSDADGNCSPFLHRNGGLLSFDDLVLAHFMRLLRNFLRLAKPDLCQAIQALRRTPFALDDLRTAVFAARPTDAVSPLWAFRDSLPLMEVRAKLLDACISRVDFDENGTPTRLYPFIGEIMADLKETSRKSVVIDPHRGFGSPTIAGTGLKVHAVAGRFRGGESMQELADDYRLPLSLVEEVIRWCVVA